MRYFKYLLVFLLLGYYGCASDNNQGYKKEKISPGQIKVSFFQLTKGKSAKGSIGIYVAMISRERNLKYGNRLNEIFEEVNTPQVTVIDDETAGEVFKFFNQEDFFSLKETPLKEFNVNNLKQVDYFTKVISVDINGIAYSVCYENLPQDQKEKFNLIQQAIFAFLTTASPKADIQLQDWRELIPEMNK